ncbi:response regulator [Christiangramia aquimixticola]|uniref:tetratricopeptide repeat-containing hybrid sensor histidine kinase/response regulator n=1 Tax=Christiangramia aquimixticola TaxID=1697558 RepID=UPI003AA872C7
MKRDFLVYFLVFFLCFNVSFSQELSSEDEEALKELYEIVQLNFTAYNYELAIDDAHNLVSRAKELNSHAYAVKGYNILGHIYSDQKDPARARKNYTLGLQYSLESNNDTLLLFSYNNLGNTYSENPETAQKGIEYYEKVIQLAIKMNSPEELIAPKSNIGWTYLDKGEYDRAYPYLKESMALMNKYIDRENENYSEWISQMYMLHGRYYGYKKQFDSSYHYFDQSLLLAESDTLLLPAADAYKAYAEVLASDKKYKSAYEAHKKYSEYNSLLFEREKLREMEAADARFNLSEYQRNLEIAEREQKLQDEIIEKSKEKVIIMVISSIVLILILVFLFKINTDRRSLISELRKKNIQFKEAKEQAENLSLLKTRFFSTVSHEIRTPLYGVIGLTSLLLEDKSLEKHKNDLKSLKFSADYLLALINDVLQMNKMESNEVKLENVSFNLRDLLKSIINSFEFTRIQNKNKIHLQVDPEVPTHIIGDSVRLSQILMNLVGNAMKFTERGDIHIIIKATEKSNNKVSIYFEIRDNGPGIPESKRKVIFEEFSQLENSNYNYQGTGLGLPIVKKLLKLFNSKIKLESKEGKGSTFSFNIKFGIDHSKKAILKEVEVDADLSLNSKKRILIVDDNRINQVVTKRILEKKDFECEVAGDGASAIEIVKNNHFDLVLMDVNMPGISGLDATREIRKFNDHLPVLALTAVEVEEIREEIQAAGMSGIIIKPYDVQQFYQIIYKNLSIATVPEKA